MSDLLRSFVRALANVFHPRMLWLTFTPFAATAIFWGAILWFFWQTLTGAANGWLEGWALTSARCIACSMQSVFCRCMR